MAPESGSRRADRVSSAELRRDLPVMKAGPKEDLTMPPGPTVLDYSRWNRDWKAMSCEVAQERRRSSWRTAQPDQPGERCSK